MTHIVALADRPVALRARPSSFLEAVARRGSSLSSPVSDQPAQIRPLSKSSSSPPNSASVPDPSPVSAFSIPVIDYASYKSCDPPSEYAKSTITLSGSIVPRPPLETVLLRYISSVGGDPRAWTGELGIRGMFYPDTEAAAIPVAEKRSAEDLSRLRGLYSAIMDAGMEREREKRLRRDLDVQARLKTELESIAAGLRRQVSELEAVVAESRALGGATSPTGAAAGEALLTEVKDELAPTEAALARSTKRAAHLYGQLEEASTCAQRRRVILEHIFGDGTDADPADFGQGSARVVAKLVSQQELAATRNKAFARYISVTRAYIDLKKGVVHLFALESTLKTILENLYDAMMRLTAGQRVTPDEAAKAPVSRSYRVRYVKSLRGSADEVLQEVLKYAPFTTLGEAARVLSANDAAAKSRGGAGGYLRGGSETSSSEGSSVDSEFGVAPEGAMRCMYFSVSAGRPTLLPEFTKVPVFSAFGTKEKIIALHERAGAAYKEVNIAYDMQSAMMKQALVDLGDAGQRLEATAGDLALVREHILFESAASSD
jgi:hypothetical protein